MYPIFHTKLLKRPRGRRRRRRPLAYNHSQTLHRSVTRDICRTALASNLITSEPCQYRRLHHLLQHPPSFTYSHILATCAYKPRKFHKFIQLHFSQRFRHHACNHLRSASVLEHNFSFQIRVLCKVITNVNMFRPLTGRIILCQFDASLIVSQNRNRFTIVDLRNSDSTNQSPQPNCFLHSQTKANMFRLVDNRATTACLFELQEIAPPCCVKHAHVSQTLLASLYVYRLDSLLVLYISTYVLHLDKQRSNKT
jgi:hypothetical protein